MVSGTSKETDIKQEQWVLDAGEGTTQPDIVYNSQ